MFRINLLIGVILYSMQLLSQKPIIDSLACENWTEVSNGAISSDGQYVVYQQRNRSGREESVNVFNVRQKRTISFKGTASALVQDSKYLFFFKSSDSVCLFNMKNKRLEYIDKIASAQIFKGGRKEWLIYSKKTSLSTFVRDLFTDSTFEIQHVKSFHYNNHGRLLLWGVETSKQWVVDYDLYRQQSDTIWQGGDLNNERAGSFVWDITGNSCSFILDESLTTVPTQRLVVYSRLPKLRRIFSPGDHLGKPATILSISGFNSDGQGVFVTIGINAPIASRMHSQAIVWSYLDEKINTQLNRADPWLYPKQDNELTFFIDARSGRFIQLEDEQFEITSTTYFPFAKGDSLRMLVKRKRGNAGEQYWNDGSIPEMFLVNIFSGEKRRLQLPGVKIGDADFTRNPRYILVRDMMTEQFMIYDVVTNKVLENRIDSDRFAGIAAWSIREDFLLYYDQYDIWKWDLRSNSAAICLTGGEGRRTGIKFSISDRIEGGILDDSKVVILGAWNKTTQENGFFIMNMKEPGELKRLTSGPYFYRSSFAAPNHFQVNGEPVQKAAKSSIYLIKRMSAKESPNYYITRDFRRFDQVSFSQPELQYNWLTTELHKWKNVEGKPNYGILYKPEDFDSTKTYPAIFYTYETLSNNLNVFLKPEFSQGRINIPWFVSQGYLVFAIDVHNVKTGDPGSTVLSSVISARDYLSGFRFVDTSKLAIQGTSFGAFTVNYLVSKTKIFAAAVSADGPSDFTSLYGSICGGPSGASTVIEKGQLEVGTPWGNTKMFFKNSAVFYAPYVQTPLLLMHTTTDDAIPFDQAVEYYLALRRLGKRAWLLEYSEGNHSVWGKSAVDYTIRMNQFFDHYLKNKPAPKWMTRSNWDRKRLANDLELDDKIKTPGEGLLTSDAKKEVENLRSEDRRRQHLNTPNWSEESQEAE